MFWHFLMSKELITIQGNTVRGRSQTIFTRFVFFWPLTPLRLHFLWYIHSGRKCLPRVACLWSKMPMFQRAGMREGGEPLPLAFQYLILMIWIPCDLDLVMISSLTSKCQDFKIGMSFFQPFYEMKLKTYKFKGQWRYHYQIQITRPLYHKNQILKC